MAQTASLLLSIYLAQCAPPYEYCSSVLTDGLISIAIPGRGCDPGLALRRTKVATIHDANVANVAADTRLHNSRCIPSHGRPLRPLLARVLRAGGEILVNIRTLRVAPGRFAKLDSSPHQYEQLVYDLQSIVALNLYKPAPWFDNSHRSRPCAGQPRDNQQSPSPRLRCANYPRHLRHLHPPRPRRASSITLKSENGLS